MAERDLAKVEAADSISVIRSKKTQVAKLVDATVVKANTDGTVRETAVSALMAETGALPQRGGDECVGFETYPV